MASFEPEMSRLGDTDPPGPDPGDPFLGAAFDGYTITRRIAAGGMGAVYEAQEANPPRAVAIKIIRPGPNIDRLSRRFTLEAALLGRLESDAIARVYRVGRAAIAGNEQPYIAMELVRGVSLTAFANGDRLDEAKARPLGMRERLTLLADVATAVNHAHAEQIIHRDLKPGNVMVTNDGRVKVLDFGLARALERSTDSSMTITAEGAIAGTPEYMSPEQARGATGEIDQRSDVYALGVLLYELLTGDRPLKAEGQPLNVFFQRVSSDTSLHAPLSSFGRSYRGDLETISQKALAKDRDERYASAAALADDLHRYLRDEPIRARRPSTWMQLRKFAKRNKLLVGGVAAITILSISFAGVIAGLYRQQTMARELAETELHLREAYEHLYGEMLTADIAENVTVVEVARRMAARLDRASAEPEIDAYLRSRLGALMLGVGAYDDARQQLTLAQAGQEHLSAEHRGMLLQSRARLAFEADSDPLVAETLLLEARRVLNDDQQDPVSVWSQLGALYFERDQLGEAQRAFAIAQQRQAAQPGPRTGEIPANRAYTLVASGEYVAAEALYRQALAADAATLGEDHSDYAVTLSNLAFSLAYQGLCDEAERPATRAAEIQLRKHGPDHRATLASNACAAFVAACRGDLETAEEGYRQVLAGQLSLFGEVHLAPAFTRAALAGVLAEAGKTAEAEALYAQSCADYGRLIGDVHRAATWFYYGLRAERLMRKQEYESASAAYTEAISAFARLEARGRVHRALADLGLAEAASMQGDASTAAVRAERALADLAEALDEDHPLLASAAIRVAKIHCMAGSVAAAEELIRDAFEQRGRLGSDLAWTQGALLVTLAEAAPSCPLPESLRSDPRIERARQELIDALGPEDSRARVLADAFPEDSADAFSD